MAETLQRRPPKQSERIRTRRESEQGGRVLSECLWDLTGCSAKQKDEKNPEETLFVWRISKLGSQCCKPLWDVSRKVKCCIFWMLKGVDLHPRSVKAALRGFFFVCLFVFILCGTYSAVYLLQKSIKNNMIKEKRLVISSIETNTCQFSSIWV